MKEEKRSNIAKEIYIEHVAESDDERKRATAKRLYGYYEAFNLRPMVVREEGNTYHVECPSLPGCVAEGSTAEEALENGKKAQYKWAEIAVENGEEIPLEDERTEFSGQFKLRIPKSLHRSMTEHAKEEGISLNQYILFLLSKNDALYSSRRNKKKQEETEEEQ